MKENFARVSNRHVNTSVSSLHLLLLKLSDHLILHPLIIRHDQLVLAVVELAEEARLGRQRPQLQFLVLCIVRVSVAVVDITKDCVSFTLVGSRRGCLGGSQLHLLALLEII